MQGNTQYLALNKCMHFSDANIEILKNETVYQAEYLQLSQEEVTCFL